MSDTTTSQAPPVAPAEMPDDDAWLRALVVRHAALLRRIAASQLGLDAADDVVSETYAAAWRDRATFDPAIASERAWLVGILLNRCRALGRAQRRWYRRAERDAHGVALADFADDANDRVDAEHLAVELLRALQALPEEQRLVLLLVARGGLTPTEVGAALAMPAATVRSHLLRARRAVAAVLNLEEGDDA